MFSARNILRTENAKKVDSPRGNEQAAGGTEVGADEVPLNTADFSSFILKIRQAKPDVVVGGLSAGDLSTFLKQWNELGMKGKIPFVEIAIGDTDIWAVGPEAARGRRADAAGGTRHDRDARFSHESPFVTTVPPPSPSDRRRAHRGALGPLRPTHLWDRRARRSG